MPKTEKRTGPKPVEPVTMGSTRIEAVHWGADLGLEQNGGYLRALDVSSGKMLWWLMVYETDYEPARERDVQDVFITRLTPGAREGSLEVEDELERRFLVDLSSRSVQALTG